VSVIVYFNAEVFSQETVSGFSTRTELLATVFEDLARPQVLAGVLLLVRPVFYEIIGFRVTRKPARFHP
jgi:hypothetical protein